MAIPGAKYWAQRAATRMDQYLWRGNETLDIISKAHAKAQADLQNAIDRIFATLQRTGTMTRDEVMEYLAHPVGKEERELLMRQIAQLPKGALRTELEIKASSEAYAYRVSRLEAMKDHIHLQATKLADVEMKAVTHSLTETIKDAYGRSIFDIQRGTGIGFQFAQMDQRAIREILQNPWSGKNFSQRIWQKRGVLESNLNEVLTSGFMSGQGTRQMTEDIAERLGVSYRNAERLVRTETNYVANAAEMAGYKEAGIEKYEFLATLDNRTSDACQEKDGEVFAVKDARPGVNMPPLHPFCRSTLVVHFDDLVLADMKRRAKDPATGEAVFVPANMKYKDWIKAQSA